MAKKGPSRRRRLFSDEFKAGAVRLVIEEKRGLREVAKELGVPTSTLSQWVTNEEERLGIKREVVPAPPGLTADERTELEQLRKRVRELETEKAILKKAAAFFAKEST